MKGPDVTLKVLVVFLGAQATRVRETAHPHPSEMASQARGLRKWGFKDSRVLGFRVYGLKDFSVLGFRAWGFKVRGCRGWSEGSIGTGVWVATSGFTVL